MPVIYQAWECDDGGVFCRKDNLAEAQRINVLTRFLFEVTADTFEEAMSIYNLRMGYRPYVPTGEPENCSICAAWYYPRGSGECWRCSSHPKHDGDT